MGVLMCVAGDDIPRNRLFSVVLDWAMARAAMAQIDPYQSFTGDRRK